jgi:hypothetical protein
MTIGSTLQQWYHLLEGEKTLTSGGCLRYLTQIRDGLSNKKGGKRKKGDGVFHPRASFCAALPSGEDMSIEEYVDTVCGILDIPIYRSRNKTLH